MFRMWISDFEKALKAVRKAGKTDMICSIEANAYGDFVVFTNEETSYIVKHNDFSVWHNYGTWREPDWREITW